MQHRQTYLLSNGPGWFPVTLCCLLLLLPTVCGTTSVLVQRSYEQETEESRVPTEEERSSEISIDPRASGRRGSDLAMTRYLAASCLKVSKSGLVDFAGCSLSSRVTPGEHELRNGVGGPLRC